METVEEYIIVFRGVNGQNISYGLRDDLIAPVAASDPTHRANDSKYFTHDEEIVDQGSILSGPEVLGADPEAIIPFTDSVITDRALIWDKMVAIFQVLDACTYTQLNEKSVEGL